MHVVHCTIIEIPTAGLTQDDFVCVQLSYFFLFFLTFRLFFSSSGRRRCRRHKIASSLGELRGLLSTKQNHHRTVVAITFEGLQTIYYATVLLPTCIDNRRISFIKIKKLLANCYQEGNSNRNQNYRLIHLRQKTKLVGKFFGLTI